MPANLKKLLIMLMIVFPTLSVAAEGIPAGAPGGSAPAPAAVTAAPAAVPAAAEKKPEAAAALPANRIGYVDINRIGTESERGKELTALLTARKVKLQGKLDSKKKQIEKMKASIEAKIAQMSPQQREAKAKEFQKKLDEFQKFARTSDEELYTLQDKESKALYNEIEKAAVAHGTANNFAVIVVRKELLYVANAVDAQDVTDALIKALNEAGQKK